MEFILNTTGHCLRFPDFVKAENCSLFDSQGNKYLDLESGIWCTSVGHCNPRITRIISGQSEKMIHSGFCYLNPVINSTAQKVLQITGIGRGKCVFLCSGSEAVEFSVRLVKSLSPKPFLLTMKNCYLSALGISGERSPVYWVHFDWMNGDNLDQIDWTQIAAFVFEPGSSLGLVHFPPKELVKKMVDKVQDSGGYLIINEVTTGMGRTGKWFGYQHYDLTPDIVALGKGLGNGYPVSCVAIAESVIEKLDLEKFHHSQSHQNDPLGAAIAGEVIDIIQSEDLLKRAEELGARIRRRLNEIKAQYGIIKEVRGRGLMIAIEFEKDCRNSFTEEVFESLIQRRIILSKRPGFEVLRLDPALTIEVEQVEYFLNNFEEIISNLKKEHLAGK